MNGRLLAILIFGLCLMAVKASPDEKKEAVPEGEPNEEDKGSNEEETASDAEKPATTEAESGKGTQANTKDTTAEPNEENADESSKEEDKEESAAAEDTKDNDKEEDSDDALPFACNLKFKRVGCYADKGKKERPLRSFIMNDADLGTTTKKGKLPLGDKFNSELPKFACKCANEAIHAGSAVFGLQNLAECWAGPDDSKYDRDGASMDCVTFDYAPCQDTAELCAGKKHANFIYYVDSPEHNKSKAEIKKEYAEYVKKVAAWRKKQDLLKKKAAKKAKKAKKGKKQ